MYFNSPHSVLSAEEATRILIKEFEKQLTPFDDNSPKVAVPSQAINFTPGSITLLETYPEHHDQKLYQTWSQYLLLSLARKKRPNVLIASTYRKSEKIINYAVCHMADFDVNLSMGIWPTRNDLVKLEHVFNDVMKLPLFFTNLDKINQVSIARLADAINETKPGLVIIEQNASYLAHTPPLHPSAESRLSKVAREHALAIAVLSKQGNDLRFARSR